MFGRYKRVRIQSAIEFLIQPELLWWEPNLGKFPGEWIELLLSSHEEPPDFQLWKLNYCGKSK